MPYSKLHNWILKKERGILFMWSQKLLVFKTEILSNWFALNCTATLNTRCLNLNSAVTSGCSTGFNRGGKRLGNHVHMKKTWPSVLIRSRKPEILQNEQNGFVYVDNLTCFQIPQSIFNLRLSCFSAEITLFLMCIQLMVHARELSTVWRSLKNENLSAAYVNTASKPTSSTASPFR